MRIPVGDEGLKVAEAVHVPEGYMLPCYIGLGYPAENAAVVEQVERPVKSTLHFGTWLRGGRKCSLTQEGGRIPSNIIQSGC